MENKENLGKGLEFNPYKSADKHYFGSFFNLAENNIESVFMEFKDRLNLKTKSTEPKDILEYHFKENCSIVDWERGIYILSDYFPIVHHLNLSIDDKRVDNSETQRRLYFVEHFTLLIEDINKLRNYYTHYYHDEISFDSKFSTFLDDSLLKTTLDVKKNYLKKDKTKEFLKVTLKVEIKKLYEIKRNQFIEKKKLDSKVRIPDDKNLMDSIFNDAFKNLLFKKENDKKEIVTVLKDFSRTAVNEYNAPKEKDFDINISVSGIIYLLSLFLSRKEIEDFKSNIKGFKGKVIKEEIEKNNSLLFMATHRVYSIQSFKGLKFRIKTSQFDKETLLMQTIDELSKVPHTVFNVLSNNDQISFVEDINEYYKDNEENEENLENSKVIHPVIRKRYDDKFNYFAIRYLDEFANFPTLKFQVHLGNYVHDNRQKKVGTSTITSERIIQEKINVFGKLSKVGNLKVDFFDKLKEEETNWDIYPNPNYNFIGNNISIHLNLKDTFANVVYQEKETIKEHDCPLLVPMGKKG